MIADTALELGIIICTYCRPELLRGCLRSVAAQRVPEGVTVRVYAVDNSDEGSAADVVQEVVAETGLDCRWMEAHPANISVARNAGIAASIEPYVVFLDDDEVCEAGWIAAIAAGLRTYPHDVFFGRVETDFEKPELASEAVEQLFSRRLDREAGFELAAFGPGKVAGITLATCNSIFRRATTLTEAAPFDVAFGHGGGEDYDLLCRLQRRGCRFGWLPDAVVREFVPAARCDGGYLRGRFYDGGQAYAAAIAGGSANVGLARWGLRARAVAQGVQLAAQLPVAIVKGGGALADYSYRWAGVLGKLSFGAIHPIYRNGDHRKTGS